jgi:predicted RNA-binding protein with PUA-like domain
LAFWLFKTERATWSWQQQENKGARGEPWSGVRNHQAAGNMKAMRVGDRGFFYHSGDEKKIVGIVEVISAYRPDPTDETGKFGLVEVKAVGALPSAVSLAAIKAEPKLQDMVLVKNSRLSVQPVTAAEWRIITAMAGLT